MGFSLITAEAICPRCGATHTLSVNPLYMPAPAGRRPGRRENAPSWREATPEQKCRYYYMRVICDMCLIGGASPGMREELKRKGWKC